MLSIKKYRSYNEFIRNIVTKKETEIKKSVSFIIDFNSELFYFKHQNFQF